MKVVFRCPPELQGLIPEPVTARRGLPDWLKGMPSQVHSEELGLDIGDGEAVSTLRGRDVGRVPDAACRRHHGRWRTTLVAMGPAGFPDDRLSARAGLVPRPRPAPGQPALRGRLLCREVHQLLDRRSPSGHRTPVHPPRQPSRPAVPHRDRPGARRYLRELHSFSRALGPMPASAGSCLAVRRWRSAIPCPWNVLEMEVATIEGAAEARFLKAGSAVRDGAGAYRRHHRSS